MNLNQILSGEFVTYQVHMLAFCEHDVRHVVVPRAELRQAEDEEAILDLVYKYGQNDFAIYEQRMPSVSMGDVIDLNGALYRVESVGFKKMTLAEFIAYHEMPRRERVFECM